MSEYLYTFKCRKIIHARNHEEAEEKFGKFVLSDDMTDTDISDQEMEELPPLDIPGAEAAR